jgi:protease-4
VGVKWHPHKRGANADLMSTSAKWDDADRKHVLDWMTEIYVIFKGHITDHRGKKLTKPIDEMAGGRVFTGKQALDLGLVDGLGGFDDAVKKAADLATLGDYELRVLPKPKGLFDFIRDATGGEETERVSIRAPKLFAMDSPLVQSALPLLGALDPARVEVLKQALVKLQLLHDEHVVLMSPFDFNLNLN